MDTSVAEIYTAVERVENRVIKWVVAVAGALGLGILRLTPFGSTNRQSEAPTVSSVSAGQNPPTKEASHWVHVRTDAERIKVLLV